MSGPLDRNEFLPAYLAEVEELLAVSREKLLLAEKAAKANERSPLPVRELFRAVHTVKGLSAMIDVEPIVEIAHLMESCLRNADRAGGRLSIAEIEPLLDGLAAIGHRVSALAANRPVPAPSPALLDALGGLVVSAPPVPPSAAPLSVGSGLDAKLSDADRAQLRAALETGLRVVRLDFTPGPEKAARQININSVREALKALGDLIKVVPLQVPKSETAPAGLRFAILLASRADDATLAQAASCAPEEVHTVSAETELPGLPPAPAPGLVPDAALEGEDRAQASVVRVATARLDDTLEQLATVFVGRARLSRAVQELTAKGADTRELQRLLGEHSRQLRDLRRGVLGLRMVPVTQVLQGIPLLLRGIQRTTGKPVRLVLELGRAEVDKVVGDRLVPAVVHLIRNAVDHALEPAAERKAKGKPEEGTVTLRSQERSSGQLELTVQDDGAGVDAHAVAAQAGAPLPETPAGLLELLCRPGLSTRANVSTTSGRGMGMDIVKGIVESLGGELLLETEAGKGTTFTLKVPLSIAIVDALVFESGGFRYAAPLAVVEELIEFADASLVRPPTLGRGEKAHSLGLLERRGRPLPVLSLEAVLGRARGAGKRALVVRHGDEALAFAVDRLVGQQEIVVRPLADALVQVDGVAGATDLGDGRPTLVLDLIGLAQASSQPSQPSRSASGVPQA